jgi:hypothetical protein
MSYDPIEARPQTPDTRTARECRADQIKAALMAHPTLGYWISFDETGADWDAVFTDLLAIVDAVPDPGPEISEPPKLTDEEIFEIRRTRAHQRNSAHVSPDHVLCAYDRCNNRLRPEMTHKKTPHIWEQALAQGWKVVWPENPTTTDLYCELNHDEHGCPLYDGPGDCQVQRR